MSARTRASSPSGAGVLRGWGPLNESGVGTFDALRNANPINLPAGVETDMLSLTGPGTLVALGFDLDVQNANIVDNIKLFVDGILHIYCDDEGIADLLESGPNTVGFRGQHMGVIVWSTPTGQQSGYIHAPLLVIPFASSLVIKYDNNGGAACTCNTITAQWVKALADRTLKADFANPKMTNNVLAGGVNTPVLDISDHGNVRWFSFQIEGVNNNCLLSSLAIEIDGVVVYTSGNSSIAELAYCPTQAIVAPGDTELHHTRQMNVYSLGGNTIAGWIGYPAIDWKFTNRFRVLVTNGDAANPIRVRCRAFYHQAFP